MPYPLYIEPLKLLILLVVFTKKTGNRAQQQSNHVSPSLHPHQEHCKSRPAILMVLITLALLRVGQVTPALSDLEYPEIFIKRIPRNTLGTFFFFFSQNGLQSRYY